MKELLLEYKETLKNTKALLNRLKENGACEDDLKNVRSWISNLEFTIKWIRTGRQPGATRGIERRAAYDREIPVEPYWIQLNKDEHVQLFEFEETEEEQEKTVNKESLVKEIMKILDKKERMVFELASKEFSQREIARFLGMPHATVQKIIQRCKRKIVEEGWIMV
ncbi:MAG TPA: sigma-70 family RNA polymerase sigma factor [Kurthia gibsonii]|nr:sigma-70 family RNA polymerase sigma factor [Kurthia gibsonii]